MATSTIKKAPSVQLKQNVYDINKGEIGPTNHANITATINCGDDIPVAVTGFRFTGTGSYSITCMRRRFTIDETAHTITVAIRVRTCVASISVTGIHCYVYYLTKTA